MYIPIQVCPIRKRFPLLQSYSGDEIETINPTRSGGVYQILRAFKFTPPKTSMDTQNDGLEKVVPFKYGHVWYLC